MGLSFYSVLFCSTHLTLRMMPVGRGSSMSDERNAIFLEDYLQRRRDYIANLQNSYHQNNTEICKHLFALAVVGFGYNLTHIDHNFSLLNFLLWFGAAIGLGLVVIFCFLIFHNTASVQTKLIQIKEHEFVQDNNSDTEIKSQTETKIKWLNRYKIAAFFSFAISMTIILTRTVLEPLSQ